MPKPHKASHTAAKVARGIVFLARDPVHASLLPDGVGKSLEEFALAAGALKPWMLRLFDSRTYQKAVFGITGSLWSGEMMRLTLRKRFFHDETRKFLEEDGKQLLIVGAGYDTLGLRMADSFPNSEVVEIDTTPTAQMRKNAIDKLRIERNNHTVIGADLGRERISEVLRDVANWDTDEASIVVAEGVLMYLDSDEVRTFLHEIKTVSGNRCRLVFSYLTADERGRPEMGKLSVLSRQMLALMGEPLRWGVKEGELDGFLENEGFRVLEPSSRYDLGDRYLRPEGIDQVVGHVERFAVAESFQLD